MPSSKILVEPDHVPVRQAVLTLVRVVAFLGGEVIALDPPDAESRFLVEGDLSYAGVAGADHRAAESAGAQIGQNARQHPLSQAAIVLSWVDGHRFELGRPRFLRIGLNDGHTKRPAISPTQRVQVALLQ